MKCTKNQSDDALVVLQSVDSYVMLKNWQELLSQRSQNAHGLRKVL